MRVGGVLLIRKLRKHIHRNGKFSIEKRQAYGTVMCAKKGGHIDMTAHIFPQKRKRNPRPSEATTFPEDTIIRQCHKRMKGEKPQAREQRDKSRKPILNRTPSGRPSENRGDFRQENGAVTCDQIPSRRTPPSPRDENFVFVTNCPPSEFSPPEPVAG